MAKKAVSDVLARHTRQTAWIVVLIFVVLLALQAIVFAVVIGLIWDESLASWLPELLIASVFLLAGGIAAFVIVSWFGRKTASKLHGAASLERHSLEMARNQANALKALAAAIGSARDVNGLFDITLDIYQLALSDLGIAAEEQANVVYLLAGNQTPAADGQLSAVAARGAIIPEEGAYLDGRQGIVGQTLTQAELLETGRLDQDPALARLPWLQDCQQVICVPLCTAHGLYGLIVLAMKQALSLTPEETDFLEAIADQVAMALHNFQVHQNLELTRLSYLAAEENERRLVRRALHEGPSRAVAAVALRLGLIRAMMIKDPGQAAQELAKMEAQSRSASLELRNLVSYMRPLELEVNDLDRALDATLNKIGNRLDLEIRVGQRALGKQLNQQARAVILYVLEGTLAWAKKSGQATAAEINLWQEQDRFYLSIDDDGYAQSMVGTEALTRNEDLATRLMRAKVGRVGGQLDITGKPGRGVTTLLAVPLDSQGVSSLA